MSIIDQFRKIAEEGYGDITFKEAGKLKRKKVDSYTASAVVKVWEGLNDENKEKYVSIPPLHMISVAHKLLGKSIKESEVSDIGTYIDKCRNLLKIEDHGVDVTIKFGFIPIANIVEENGKWYVILNDKEIDGGLPSKEVAMKRLLSYVGG